MWLCALLIRMNGYTYFEYALNACKYANSYYFRIICRNRTNRTNANGIIYWIYTIQVENYRENKNHHSDFEFKLRNYWYKKKNHHQKGITELLIQKNHEIQHANFLVIVPLEEQLES